MKGLTLTSKEQNRLSIMNGVLERQWAVSEAAELLGLSERHTWRLLAAYRKEGAAALAHGNRGHSPSNITSQAVQTQVITLARDRYQGVNQTHFTELLAEREGITLSRATVRHLLLGVGLSSARHRRPPTHRYRRMRMPQEGMLIQIDGSHHRWLGQYGSWLTLLLAVDDATGTVPYALFREQEDTEGYFHLMKGIIERRGIPLALYSDRYFVFCYSKAGSKPGECIIDKGKPTQFGRAMRELGITQVFARSPEAKGRIERANGTFQDRLVSELRLAGATTIDEANRILESFLPRFNERFGVPATDPKSSYRPVNPELDIDAVLCFKERRRVAKDNTVQYHGQTLQIFPGPADRHSYARAHVEVQERLDGSLMIYYQGKTLTPREAPPLATELRARAEEISQHGLPVINPEPDIVAHDFCPKEARHSVIWYEDSEMKRIHRELVKAGMERARQQGKRIGRPQVVERPEFEQHFTAVMESVRLGLLSRRQAAKELAIGYATLKRILDVKSKQMDPDVSITIEKQYAEVLN
jgi:transposase